MLKPTVNDWKQIVNKTKSEFFNAKIMIRCQMHVNFADFLKCSVFYTFETVDENELIKANAYQKLTSIMKIVETIFPFVVGGFMFPNEIETQTDSPLSKIEKKILLPVFVSSYFFSQSSSPAFISLPLSLSSISFFVPFFPSLWNFRSKKKKKKKKNRQNPY